MEAEAHSHGCVKPGDPLERAGSKPSRSDLIQSQPRAARLQKLHLLRQLGTGQALPSAGVKRYWRLRCPNYCLPASYRFNPGAGGQSLEHSAVTAVCRRRADGQHRQGDGEEGESAMEATEPHLGTNREGQAAAVEGD